MALKPFSNGPKHHFFGYYGINPWDRNFRYHLALETDFHRHVPTPTDIAQVGLVDKRSGDFTPVASTSAFNLQQLSTIGMMIAWFPVPSPWPRESHVQSKVPSLLSRQLPPTLSV